MESGVGVGEGRAVGVSLCLPLLLKAHQQRYIQIITAFWTCFIRPFMQRPFKTGESSNLATAKGRWAVSPTRALPGTLAARNWDVAARVRLGCKEFGHSCLERARQRLAYSPARVLPGELAETPHALPWHGGGHGSAQPAGKWWPPTCTVAISWCKAHLAWVLLQQLFCRQSMPQQHHTRTSSSKRRTFCVPGHAGTNCWNSCSSVSTTSIAAQDAQSMLKQACTCTWAQSPLYTYPNAHVSPLTYTHCGEPSSVSTQPVLQAWTKQAQVCTYTWAQAPLQLCRNAHPRSRTHCRAFNCCGTARIASHMQHTTPSMDALNCTDASARTHLSPRQANMR